MKRNKLLCSFYLLDQFGFTKAQLLKEAKVAAERRADMQGWSISKVTRAAGRSKKLNGSLTYRYNVFGIVL